MEDLITNLKEVESVKKSPELLRDMEELCMKYVGLKGDPKVFLQVKEDVDAVLKQHGVDTKRPLYVVLPERLPGVTTPESTRGRGIGIQLIPVSLYGGMALAGYALREGFLEQYTLVTQMKSGPFEEESCRVGDRLFTFNPMDGFRESVCVKRTTDCR